VCGFVTSSLPSTYDSIGAGARPSRRPGEDREVLHALEVGIAGPFLDLAFSLPAFAENASLAVRPS